MTVIPGLVSVILPVCNGAAFLPVTLQGVQQQDYPAMEVLVIDDGSVDDSPHILAAFAAACPRDITILTHPGRQQRGIAASYRLGLSHCRGEYIAFCEQDDLWPPHKLSVQLSILARWPEVGVVSSGVYLCNAAGQIAPAPYTALLNRPPTNRPFHAFWRLLWGNYVYTFSNMLVRAHHLSPADILDEPPGFQDWMLLLLLSRRCAFYHCPTPPIFWRQQADSYSALQRQLPTFRRLRLAALRQALASLLSADTSSSDSLYRGPGATRYWQTVLWLYHTLEGVAERGRQWWRPRWALAGGDALRAHGVGGREAHAHDMMHSPALQETWSDVHAHAPHRGKP